MRNFPHWSGMIATCLAIVLAAPSIQAGRIGGPTATVSYIPAGEYVNFEIPFNEGLAAVEIVGSGTSILHLVMYDTDGHTTVSTGFWDHQVVRMNVYRAGMFRIQVRNLGDKDNRFTLRTN